MPMAPPRPCVRTGCGRLNCEEHVRPAWGHDKPPRIRGSKLQRMRARLFDKEPLCVLCQAQGRVSIATIRDHVINLKAGGRDDESNEQAICEACHRVKTAEEARCGRFPDGQ